jgi:hypothetical protein
MRVRRCPFQGCGCCCGWIARCAAVAEPTVADRRGYPRRSPLSSRGMEAPSCPRVTSSCSAPRATIAPPCAGVFQPAAAGDNFTAHGDDAAKHRAERLRAYGMNLLHWTPDNQEALLLLPPTVRGRDALGLTDRMPIAAAFALAKATPLAAQAPHHRSQRHPLVRLGTNGPRRAHGGPRCVHAAAVAPDVDNQAQAPRHAPPRGRLEP